MLLNKKILLFCIGILLCGHSFSHILEKQINFYDKARDRIIPVKQYFKAHYLNSLPLVVINHGYTVSYTEYQFIAHALAERGYYVISIQHDLKTDKPFPVKKTIFETRTPMWTRGVENIVFIIDNLKISKSLMNKQIILIGHSNGGDIAMKFATNYPKRVAKIISLDSLRYPFPIDKNIPILHFRAIDTIPDPGIIPKGVIKTIYIKNAKHIALSDRGNSGIKDQIKQKIIKFLE